MAKYDDIPKALFYRLRLSKILLFSRHVIIELFALWDCKSINDIIKNGWDLYARANQIKNIEFVKTWIFTQILIPTYS